jgi:hypothetical protein
MPGRKPQQVLLAIAFLAAIYSVGLLQAGIEVSFGRRPKLLDLFRKAPTAANFRSYEKELDQASWLTRHTRPAMQFLRFVALKETPEQVLPGHEPWFFYRPAVQYYVEPLPLKHLSGQVPDDLVPAITAYRDELARRHVHLLVMLAPNKAGIYPEMLAARAKSANPPVCTHTLKVSARLREAGIEMVDLYALYAQARAEKPETLCYLPADTHWSPEGMRLAAEHVARHIFDRGWLTRGAARYRLQTIVVRRQGDLLEMLDNPWIAGLYAPRDIECARVVGAEGSRPSADDPAAEVLVLGDSFLRIYQRDEPGGAGFVAHLAYQLQRPVASIIGDGGASTLVRQQLSRKPALLANKKVVIWEFVERDIRFGTEGWQDIGLPPPTTPLASPAGR